MIQNIHFSIETFLILMYLTINLFIRMSFDNNSRAVDIKAKLNSLQLSYQGTKKGFLQILNAYLAEQSDETAEATPAAAEVTAASEQPAPLA